MHGIIQNNGVNIHYVMNNNSLSKITLLFVPGGMMPLWVWEKQIAYFSQNYTTVAIDPRSQGESSETPEGQYAEGRASDIRAVVNGLNLRNVIFIGWSLAVSELVVYHHVYGEEGINGLVLVDGLVGLDVGSRIFQEMRDYWLEVQKDRKKMTAEFVKGMFVQSQPTGVIESLTNEAMKVPTATMVSFILNLILTDYRSLLSSISVPTFIIGCKGQREENMLEVQQLIPRSHLMMIENAGHALFMDQPDLFNAALQKFIGSIE